MLKKKMGVSRANSITPSKKNPTVYDFGLFKMEIDNSEPPKKLTKTLKLKHQNPQQLRFSVAGMEYAVKEIKGIKKRKKLFEELSEGQPIRVVHERKNKVDEFACALYYKNIKIGYIPRYCNREIIECAKKNKNFIFIVTKSFDYDEFVDGYKRPEILALCF